MTKICLCAIFRNESKNVKRCLDAAKPVLDFISICDTGSTDNTIELIEQWGREHGIPTKVHSEPFINFGHNRTRSFDLAVESFPEADYVLLLDADLILQVGADWQKSDLTKDAYLVRQVQPFIDYWNTRLVKANLPWKSVGVTHEYWECQLPHQQGKLTSLVIDDREDGGHKGNKYERDKGLLHAGIDDPATPDGLKTRYYFYLAQTYRDMNDKGNAYIFYEKRVKRGGWIEEVYISQCEKARICIQLEMDHKIILDEHLKAFAIRPTRAEALWQLAAYCREKERYAEGYLFSKIGKDIPLTDDILFVKRDVYEWRLLDEFSICAYWINSYDEAFLACDKLLQEGFFPDTEKQRILSNKNFSFEKIRERLMGAQSQ